MATETFITKGIQYLGKKAVEMGRCYGPELLRKPKLQKRAIDYALEKFNPAIQSVGSQALNQLSTKIRPKKKYKTNRKDLDGGAIDIQSLQKQKLLPEFHLRTFPGLKKYQFCCPNTRLDERLSRGDEGINRLNQACKQHDIDYSNSKTLADKHKADQKNDRCHRTISNQSLTERAIKNTMRLKKRLGLGFN